MKKLLLALCYGTSLMIWGCNSPDIVSEAPLEPPMETNRDVKSAINHAELIMNIKQLRYIEAQTDQDLIDEAGIIYSGLSGEDVDLVQMRTCFSDIMADNSGSQPFVLSETASKEITQFLETDSTLKKSIAEILNTIQQSYGACVRMTEKKCPGSCDLYGAMAGVKTAHHHFQLVEE